MWWFTRQWVTWHYLACTSPSLLLYQLPKINGCYLLNSPHKYFYKCGVICKFVVLGNLEFELTPLLFCRLCMGLFFLWTPIFPNDPFPGHYIKNKDFYLMCFPNLIQCIFEMMHWYITVSITPVPSCCIRAWWLALVDSEAYWLSRCCISTW
jgi:hypothetical protein